MGHTLVAALSGKDCRMLHGLLDTPTLEQLCKIPFGRGADREQADRRIPYHATLFHWAKEQDGLYLPKLESLTVDPFSLNVKGPELWSGAKDSGVLVLSVEPGRGYKDAEQRLSKALGRPLGGSLHVTLAVSQDVAFLRTLERRVQQATLPRELRVEQLQLYHIWKPVQLVRTFSGTKA